jgi:hypothetical protein
MDVGKEAIVAKGCRLLVASQFVGNGSNGRIPNDRSVYKV